jgi:hypothetical protein
MGWDKGSVLHMRWDKGSVLHMRWDKGSVLHMRWDKGSVLHMRTMAELMAEHVSDRELDVWDYDGWGHAS